MHMILRWSVMAVVFLGYGLVQAEQDADCLVKIPIAREGRLILLPVTVGDQEYSFLFDTGSSFTIFDTSLRQHLGDPSGEIRIASAGNTNVQAFKPPPVRLGAMRLALNKPVCCQDMAFVRNATHLDVRGVIGIEGFLNHVVRVNFDQGTFTVHKPDAGASADWGEPVPLAIHQRGTPFVTAEVPWGDPAQFMIDTGDASTGSLVPLLFEHLYQSTSLTPAGVKTTLSIRGVEQLRFGHIKSFKLGPFRHTRLLFGEKEPATLGLGYWSRYEVTFDFSSLILYLRKGKLYDAYFPPEASGLTLRSRNGDLFVYAVDPGGSADGSGIQAGDVVLAIQGRPAGEYDLFELYERVFTRIGQNIAMKVKRGEEVHDVSFVLQSAAHPPSANTATAQSQTPQQEAY